MNIQTLLFDAQNSAGFLNLCLEYYGRGSGWDIFTIVMAAEITVHTKWYNVLPVRQHSN